MTDENGGDGLSLAGKVAIVTGAARGLGRDYACRLAGAGASVVAADVADCADTAAAASAAGGSDCIAVEADVGDAAATEAMARRALDAFGRIDVLVNNAALYGSLKGGPFDELPEADWDACMTVNVKGVWNCCKAVAPAMREQGGGSIVNISSLAATYGLPNALHYTTSKAAVIGLTEGSPASLAATGFESTRSPSAVATEGTAEFFGARAERAFEVIRDGQALRQNLEPGDVAGTVLYLASDASRFMTGQTLMVDGGTVFL